MIMVKGLCQTIGGGSKHPRYIKKVRPRRTEKKKAGEKELTSERNQRGQS
jgi:hypothetical protein